MSELPAGLLMFMAAAAALAYPLLMLLLLRLSLPTWRRLLSVGDDLRRSSNITERERDIVDREPGDFHDWRFMIALAVSLPAVMVNSPARRFRGWDAGTGSEERRHLETFLRLWLWLGAAANPLFTVIVLVEVMPLLAVAATFGRPRAAWRVVERAALLGNRLLSRLDRAVSWRSKS